MFWNEFSREARTSPKAFIPTLMLRKISGSSYFPPIILFFQFLPVPLQSFTFDLKGFGLTRGFWEQAAAGWGRVVYMRLFFLSALWESQLLKHSCRLMFTSKHSTCRPGRETRLWQFNVVCQSFIHLFVSQHLLTLHARNFNFPRIFHDFFASVKVRNELQLVLAFWISLSTMLNVLLKQTNAVFI